MYTRDMVPLQRNLMAIFSLLVLSQQVQAADLECAGTATRRVSVQALDPKEGVRVLVIFARFLDENGPSMAPAFGADLFDPELPGSLTHFFDEMSSGQFSFTGEVLPRIYVSKSGTEEYLGANNGRGDFGRFTREILAAADVDVDFGRFDNDGPDGLPNSGDDDGFVDLLLLVTQSTPSGFILGDADGVAQLGLDSPYSTQDVAALRGRIGVRADGGSAGGTLQRGLNFSDAVGIIAHEVGHLLGLPDLYDRVKDRGGIVEFGDDSAGIGYWGLMGHGARGWDDRGGPTPFCAWSRKRLGWLGVDNKRLVPITDSVAAAFLGDVNDGGIVYQMPLVDDEYLLVEHRSAAVSHYERHLPADGVLVWHIRPERVNNDDERAKVVDLVCADGLYHDAGYPLGTRAAPDLGQDNLDYYSGDGEFRTTHAGNLGDATDVFDGIRFVDYQPLSNPAINGLSINNVRRAGAGFSADLVLRDPRRAGRLTGLQTWRDTIHVIGDVTITTGASVSLAPRTVVLVSADGRHTGDDTERVEIVVNGTLNSSGATSRFQSAADVPTPGDWTGITVSATGQLSLGSTSIEHTQEAIVVRGGREGLTLNGVRVGQTTGNAIQLFSVTGRVRLLHVTVEGVGGDAVSLIGGDPVVADDLRLLDNGGHGLIRADGKLTLNNSELTGNGEAIGGYDLWLREGTSGTIHGTTFSGTGEGTRVELNRLLTFEENEWSGYRVALRTRSANPRIRSNVFVGVDTVLSLQGFRVPSLVQLNVVSASQILVVNETDQPLKAGRNWWGTTEIAVITSAMSGLVDWDPALNFDPRLPVDFFLAQNFPNPFNSGTTIDFTVSLLEISLSTGERMTLDVRTITGGLVRRIFEQAAAPGIYRVLWDGRDETGRAAASGVYFYELSVGPIRLLRRLTVLR